MPTVSLSRIVSECDRLFRPSEFPDSDGAVNGLQVENGGRVSRLAAAVDAGLGAIEGAIKAGANLLLVHHGLFWSSRQPWTGANFQVLRRLLDNDLAVYSVHLPLDAHPTLGNNILLARALGLRRHRPFFEFRGRAIGLRGELRVAREELRERLKSAVGGGAVRLLASGPATSRRVAIITGGAGAELARVAAEGIDTFVTGEGPHWTFTLAHELGVNVFYAGHYATETFGVRALAAHLGRKFDLPHEFIDVPSGL